MEKDYVLKPEEIKRMIPDIGLGFVSDKIAVEGKKVHFMSREPTDQGDDSGWVFLGGGETVEYTNDPNNFSMLQVNTIANFDPEIISFLTYPPNTEIERKEEGKLEILGKDVQVPDILFMPPVEPGRVSITKEWSIELDHRMTRRFDNGSLVIWKPDFTIWLHVFTVSNETISERMAIIYDEESQGCIDTQEVEVEGLHRVRKHFLGEEAGDESKSVHIHGLTELDQIHLAIYYEQESQISEIDKIWETLKYKR